MKKVNLFTKLIVPILFIGILVSYSGYLYLNAIMEKTIYQEIEQKVKNNIEHTYSSIESEFKLLFYLYGTSSIDYDVEETLAKKDVLNHLQFSMKKSDDIIYIIDPNEYIQISELYLTSSELARIARTHQQYIQINEKRYRIEQLYFQPWNWNIIYLLDTSNFEDIVLKNKLTLLGIVYVLLFFLVIVIIVMFKLYIKRPIDLLLNHFSAIVDGKYLHINQQYNTKEIDKLIMDVNNMTQSIEYRENEAERLLGLTQKNEAYMKDILSSQSNIIIINNSVEIFDVNDSFWVFFHEYSSLEEFKKEHDCICDYFIEEEGYIYSFKDKNWVQYVLENQNMVHKVKIFKDERYHIYTVQASKSEKYERIIITMTDITEFEKSNNLLKQYKKAVDAGTIVSKTDRKGIITYVNDKFLNISGFTADELLGQSHSIVNSPRMSREIFKDMWETIQSKQIWSGNIENIRKDRSAYMVAATVVPILDFHGEIIEFIALRYDITEHMDAIARSKKAENTKSLFLANMSHEIRTPLNAIIGFTKILKNSPLEKKEANYINVIDQSAENLLGIVNDVLDISKIENGSLVCESVEFNPFKEFNAVFDLFSAKAREKNIEIFSVIDSRILQKIIGDPLRIKQVLSNLLSNALKFSPQNAKIELEVKLKSQDKKTCTISFSVKDYGIGISQNKQKTIFEDFSQADDSTSRQYGGTGLGLSISNKIVQALGSHIQLESEEGKGSRFFFSLDYKINRDNNKSLEGLKKVHVAIILSSTIEEYDLEYLKYYLESIVHLTLYENDDDLESLLKEDIIFIAEESHLKNIKRIDDEGSTKIVVLSHIKTECTTFRNSVILNTPYNRSIIFDILMGCIDSTKIVSHTAHNTYAQYKGEILVAEDHDINQQLISMLLELRGLQAVFANNGVEAIDLFEKNKYDLILMDINMPIKNGKEATAAIILLEQEKNLKHTPIVALTANAIEQDKNETMKIGFDDYLLKPIDEEKLDMVLQKNLHVEIEGTFEEEDESSFDENMSDSDVELNTDTPYSIEEASKITGLPLMVMEKIVASFIQSIDGDVKKLEEALASGDFNEIANAAHKIKGASLNLRMENIALLTADIEAKAKEKSTKGFRSNFTELLKEVDLLKN